MYRRDSRSPPSRSPSRSRSRPRPRPQSVVRARSQSRPRSPPSRAPSRPRSRAPPQSSRSPSPQNPPPAPVPQPSRRSPKKSNRRSRGYSLPQDGKSSRPRSSEVTLTLCVFHTTSHNWSTHVFKFNPKRTNDRELWTDIRYTFRTDLQKPWRRILGFKKVKSIVPISYTPNGVPVRTDPKDYPDSKTFMHAYHHPDRIRPEHFWVDWFMQFDAGDVRPNGLEFVEGLWADKLAAIAIIFSVAIVAVSIVWCALGGNLQTVFTVMGFVLSFVAAELALAALYYQVALPN